VFQGSLAKDRRYQGWSACASSERYCAMRMGRSMVGRVVPNRVWRMPRRPSGPVTTVVPALFEPSSFASRLPWCSVEGPPELNAHPCSFWLT
jgi:hypothetical protein